MDFHSDLTGSELFTDSDFRDMLKRHGHQFASATFTKKDGTVRKMQFAYRIGKRGTPTGDRLLNGGSASYDFSERKHLSVVDLGLYRRMLRTADDQPRINPYRVVNFNNLHAIRLGGVTIIPKDSPLHKANQ